MNRSVRILVPTQVICFGCAVLMSFWTGTPGSAIVALSLLAVSGMAPDVVSPAQRERVLDTSVTWAGTCSAALLLLLLLPGGEDPRLGRYLDMYYAAEAWLIAAGLYLGGVTAASGRSRRRGGLVVAWALLGTFLWLAAAYLENLVGLFYLGLLNLLAVLVVCHFWFQLPKPGIQAVNSLILLTIGVPVADFLVLPPYSLRNDAKKRQIFYSFEAAKANPAAFARWWSFYLSQWQETERQIAGPDPEYYLPCRLRPNSHALLLQSRIVINSRGFRGKEIAEDKGDAYRIVALGESTTFGITLNAEDRPWPEHLEQIIRERLRTRRPVEVINAGVFGYAVGDSLHRFATDILPLKPDLVISYHGINGFIMLNPALPSTFGASKAPAYQQRPLRLLANCEYRLKLRRFRQSQVAAVKRQPPAELSPMQTGCAQTYRELCQLAATNHIRVALANFSMALNSNSTPDAIDFYQVGYPAARWLIPANAMQTQILQQLAQDHPAEICFVDTRPALDGVPRNFLDLVHFSPAGDQQMAENVFAGLRPILEQDLVEPQQTRPGK
jgi:lysophospholipase L1-like esterase